MGGIRQSRVEGNPVTEYVRICRPTAIVCAGWWMVLLVALLKAARKGGGEDKGERGCVRDIADRGRDAWMLGTCGGGGRGLKGVCVYTPQKEYHLLHDDYTAVCTYTYACTSA